jgi:hypothetical protein
MLTGALRSFSGALRSLSGFFWVFKTKFDKLLEMRSFFFSLYYFGSWQTTRFEKRILSNGWRCSNVDGRQLYNASDQI